MRYYLAMVRDYEWRCGGPAVSSRLVEDDKPVVTQWYRCIGVPKELRIDRGFITSDGQLKPCTHAPVALDTWSPYHNNDGLSIYVNVGKARNRVKRVVQGNEYWMNQPNPILEYLPREAKVVYFDTEDLLTYTDDPDVQYQEHEAKMLRAADEADKAKRMTNGK